MRVGWLSPTESMSNPSDFGAGILVCGKLGRAWAPGIIGIPPWAGTLYWTGATPPGAGIAPGGTIMGPPGGIMPGGIIPGIPGIGPAGGPPGAPNWPGALS